MLSCQSEWTNVAALPPLAGVESTAQRLLAVLTTAEQVVLVCLREPHAEDVRVLVGKNQVGHHHELSARELSGA